MVREAAERQAIRKQRKSLFVGAKLTTAQPNFSVELNCGAVFMDSSAPPSAVTSQSPLHAAATRFKDLIGGIFKEVFATSSFLMLVWLRIWIVHNSQANQCRLCSLSGVTIIMGSKHISFTSPVSHCCLLSEHREELGRSSPIGPHFPDLPA